MTSQARVVVIGGGCVGAAVLYGLARRGWTDCVLLERSRFAGASTRLAGGVIPTYVRSDAASRMINKTLAIYKGLEAETGLSVGWHPCGQMRLARSRERLDEYRSYMNVAEAIGANARLLAPDEVKARWPLYRSTEGMLGALFHPDDGYVGPTDVTMSLLKGARDRGARMRENAQVTAITSMPSGEWRVELGEDSILCEHVVLATGAFARQTGAMLGLDIPALPVIVQYWFTGPVPDVVERRRRGEPEFPITRDDHFLGYMREEGDGLLWGTYERPETLEVFALDRVPDSYDGEPLPEKLDADLWGLERAAELMPSFAEAGLRSNLRGPMQMTADGMPLIGPAWGRRNVWLAEGVPGGILWGGAIGYYLSEWIVEGGTSIDMNEVDARRFGSYATRDWVRGRARELWGMHSDVIPPGQEMLASRPACTGPAYDLLSAQGAVWGSAGGWEVANWYAPESVPRVDALGYRDSPTQCWVGEEALAIRHGVGLIDSTSTSRLEVSGPGAVRFLDSVLATPLPPPGTVGAGYILFDNGGVRAGISVYRLDETVFELSCGPSSERLYADELWRRLPPDGSVMLRPMTMQYGAFEIAGPLARDVLAELVEMNVGPGAFPLGGIRCTSVGVVRDVRVVRTGATGELGWELIHPIAYQRALLERILAVGAPYGLRLVGQRALKPLRLEKSYAAVGPDMNAGISAVEAGIVAALDLGKGVFPGRDAVIRLGAAAPGRSLATIAIATEGASVLGHESVQHDGRTVGRITSGAYSPYFRHDIALALLPTELNVPGTELHVPVLDAIRTARVIPRSPYDPQNVRLTM